MTDLRAIRVLRSILKHTNRWYIEPCCLDIDEFKTVCEKARMIADKKLSRMSVWGLYFRYKKWCKSDPIIAPNEEYYDCFLNQILYDIGRASLSGRDLLIFEEECYLSIKFIN